MSTKIRLTNTFHNTHINLIPKDIVRDNREPYVKIYRLSEQQMERAERALCGNPDCLCGNHGPDWSWAFEYGVRGPALVSIDLRVEEID